MINNIFKIIFLPAGLSLLTMCNCNNSEISNENQLPKYSLTIDKDSKTQVSSHLMGFNLVYAYEADSLWSDGKIEAQLINANTSVLRYPGGTVSTFYHWNNLTGEGWKDSWDPDNPVIPKDDSEFMNIDKFIALTKRTKATPLVGINMCSGRRWNRVEDAINEALELMKYCKDNEFDVTYWYLGNEPYQSDSNGGSKTAEEYAELINKFVPRMKEFNPDIKIIANWNAAFKNRKSEYQQLLSLAGHNIDVIDVHWYWSWSEPTWEKWCSETPIQLWTGDSYIQEIEFFHEMCRESGYENMELASLEWNVGPIRNNQLNANQTALIQAEMMMTFINEGLDMATFWPIHGPGHTAAPRGVINRKDRSPQPIIPVFNFLGQLQGNFLYDFNIIEDHPHVVSSILTNQDESNMWICLLNKNNFEIEAEVSGLIKQIRVKEAKVYYITNEGQGSELKEIEDIHLSRNNISFKLQANSLSMLKLDKKSILTFN